MKGRCLICLKILTFLFSLIIFLAGVFLLYVGRKTLRGLGLLAEVLEISAEDQHTSDTAAYASASYVTYGAYVLLAVGVLLLPLGALGCVGAIRENKCLLLTFFIILLILFLAELGVTIFLLQFLYRSKELIRSDMTARLQSEYQGTNKADDNSRIWNSIMTIFECCGVNGPEDFEWSLFRRLNPDADVPEACCHSDRLLGDSYINRLFGSDDDSQFGNTLLCTQYSIGIHKQGCYSALGLDKSIETQCYWIGAATIGALTIKLVAMTFAICLFRAIK